MIVPFVDLKPQHEQIGAELDAAWHRVKSGGRFVLGEMVQEFERQFARYCEVAAAVGVGNGLEAISLVLRALGIGAGDEVIVPANTFIATWLAVSDVGAVPVPADCDNQTGNLSVDAARQKISSRTKAIIVVHLYGYPAALGELEEFAKRHGVYLIEDAAQAHGARYSGRCAGSVGIAGTFSFYPTKNLGALGDGGAVVTADERLADKVRLLSNYGARAKYDHQEKGRNSRLDELQAAVLLAKLPHLDQWNAERRDIAAAYDRAFDRVPHLRHLPAANAVEPVYHLYVVRHKGRDELATRLSESGVQTMVHYPAPPHLQPAFSDLKYGPGSYPVAEQISQESLSLPIWPGMSKRQIEHVMQAVSDSCAAFASREGAR